MSVSECQRNTIAYHVSLLSKYFDVDLLNEYDALKFVDKLERSVATSSEIESKLNHSVTNILQDNRISEEFFESYENLKLRNYKELPRIIQLLSFLRSDPDTLRILASVTSRSKGATDTRRVSSADIAVSALSGEFYDNILIPLDEGQFNKRHRETSHVVVPPFSSPPGTSTPFCLSGTRKPKDISETKNPHNSSVEPESWYSHATLSGDFLPIFVVTPSQPLPIESLSISVQEHAIVNDLLQCLQGNQGIYIKPLPLQNRNSIRAFKVDDKITPTLLDTVSKILQICSDYSTITRFVHDKSALELGMVSHALASAMRLFLQDYMILVCRLELQHKMSGLGIVKLHFLLQETASTFSHITRLIMDIYMGECSGGTILSVLWDSMQSVCNVKHLYKLMFHLVYSASVPFFQILQKWLYRGIISDPYKEFFITAGDVTDLSDHSKSPPRNLYSGPLQFDRLTQSYVDWAYFWESHYFLVSSKLPSFLEASASKILNTGKYLNVVQLCGDHYELPVCEEIAYNEEHSVFLEKIDKAYLYASSLLLDLMLKQKELKEHFKSVKRFLLLDQGDFIVHFMDAAEGELRKSSEVVSESRLSSLLELAVRISSANADPFKDNLKVVIFRFDLITQILMVLRAGSRDKLDSCIEDRNLSGLEAFCLDYTVDWPVDLVLNRQVMDRYQMLFRHLLYCKHVERLLCNSWILGKLARKSDNLMTTSFTVAFILAQRMLTFIQHFQYYMTAEIIEPAWHTFFMRLDKVSNLDELLESHLHFLEICLDDCLLANPKLLSLVGKLSVACVTFSNFIQHLAYTITGINLSSDNDRHDVNFIRRSTDLGRTFLHDPTPSTVLGKATNESRCAPYGSLNGSTESIAKVTREEFGRMSLSDDFAKTIANFDINFNRLLVELLEEIKKYTHYPSKLSGLVSRLVISSCLFIAAPTQYILFFFC
ncbi:unnamed protein product [Trichobilharzia szidati]|nr:unnamed protein product [Trichobilharzia szidati]